MELHKGSIWVESAGEGKGSVFTFRIPLLQVETAPQPPESPDDNRPLVLVVENDELSAHLLEEYLQSGGYRIARAGLANEAVEMARQLHPYAITMDIELPDEPGWTALQRIKSDPRTARIPIIVVSVLSQEKFGKDLGADEYFVKPLKKEDLLRAIQRLGEEAIKYSKTVLVIDDEPVTVGLLAEIIKEKGFQVVQAFSGQQGVDIAFGKHPPNLIILDLGMPGITGEDVIKRLRSNSRTENIPIIIFTGLPLTEAKIKELRTNVQALTFKPDHSRIIEELEKLLTPVVSTSLKK